MLRRATDADRDIVLPWRNHPEVRAASLTRHVIGAEEHAEWWSRALADPTREVLVYERGGVPAGIVTFFDIDRAARSAWWGFYLDVTGLEDRGELLLAWIEVERDAIRHAFGELDLAVIVGEVLASNLAVRGLHKRHRFRETAAYDRHVDGTAEPVVRVELHAEDARSRSRS